MTSSAPALSFYFDMLFNGSIQSVKDSFIGNSTLLENGYSYVSEHRCYIKEEMVQDDETMPVFVTDVITREDFMERLLNLENTSIYRLIEAEVSRLVSKQERCDYLNKVYEDIQVLLKRVLNLEDNRIGLIEDKLIEVLKNLKDRYSSIIVYHEVYKYLIKESDATFFDNKSLKYSFYQDLYEMAYSLDLIDDAEIEELDFINAFTSPKPKILEKKVRFSKSNYIVAYFLEVLKPFFNELNPMAIEKSEVFLNKQNKLIKSSDIYVSLSRGKNKIENEKSKIDYYILQLKNKHLK